MARPVVKFRLKPGWQALVMLAWGVLTFGAVYPWAYWPLFAGATALGLKGVVTERAWEEPRLRGLLVAFGVLVAAIALQSVALPSWLVLRLSPGADEFFRVFRIGYHPAQLQTLSLDPAATRVVLAEATALALLLVGLARLLRRWPLEWLVGQVMALAVAVALVGIVQKALLDADTKLIYGFWQPRQGGEIFGPFVNRNHFAGWMVMTLPLIASYGWALSRGTAAGLRWGGTWIRWLGSVEGNRVLLVGGCVLIMAVSLVMTGSRSGMAAVVVGMAVLLASVWRNSAVRGARLVAAALVVSVLALATVWAGAGTVASRFGRASDDVGGRLSAWADTIRIAGDFPVFGTGLGGYRTAMLVYQTHDREALYAQAHNDYLQLIAEGGLLVTLPALVVAVLMILLAVRRLRLGDGDPVTFWVRRGAVAGLVGIGAQSVVEFSLQMPGNAAMFVVLTALAVHRPRSYSHANRV